MNIKFDKISEMFEAHIDKLVLGVIGIVAIFLLWVYVISNPYGIKIAGKQGKMAPAEIDPYVEQQAKQLSLSLDETASPLPPVQQYARNYTRMVENALPDLAVDLPIPYPSLGDKLVQEDRLYALPVIPDMTDVQIASMRGAARIPDEEVGPDTPYETAMAMQGDVDLVTVSARLDIDTLFNNFQSSFMGPRLQPSWKDPILANPVFARLQLQRRQQIGTGQWSSWEDVPPANVETYRQEIMALPFELKDSQYGVDIWIAQFNSPDFQQQILQPQSYQFTVSRTEWMPPEYLEETLKILEETKRQQRRDELEERRNLNDRTTPGRRTNTRPGADRTNTQRGRGAARGPLMGMEMGVEGVGLPRQPQRPKERTVEDVSKEYEEQLLDEKTTFQSIREPLLVWANDDTVEPGQTYQYRIRIGLFNPIAGKDWFTDGQREYKEKIVLWSQFAEPENTVSIPRRYYVFPTDTMTASMGGDTTQGAVVEVMKYHLGRWREHEFEVYPGEIIGYEVDIAEEENKIVDTPATPQLIGIMTGDVTESDGKVDFDTGYTFIDLRTKTTWGSGTRLRSSDTLQELLYFDGSSMQILPVGQSNWDRSMRDQYRDIQNQIDEEVEVREGMNDYMPPLPGNRM